MTDASFFPDDVPVRCGWETKLPGIDDLVRNGMITASNHLEPSAIPDPQDELQEIVWNLTYLLEQLFARDSFRNCRMFILFYGLGTGQKRKTLSQLGRLHGVSGTRSHQVIMGIWKRFASDPHAITEEELLHYIARIPLLEEGTHTAFPWEKILPVSDQQEAAYLSPLGTCSAATEQHLKQIREGLRVLQATAREAMEEDFRIFCFYYGLDDQEGRKTRRMTSEYFGIHPLQVRNALARVWGRLAPYKRHIGEQKIRAWLKLIPQLEEALRSASEP